MNAEHKCSGPNCPGLPYRASDVTHPASCADPAMITVRIPLDLADSVECAIYRAADSCRADKAHDPEDMPKLQRYADRLEELAEQIADAAKCTVLP